MNVGLAILGLGVFCLCCLIHSWIDRDVQRRREDRLNEARQLLPNTMLAQERIRQEEKAPRDRAQELLERWLSPAQLYRLRQSRWFDVVGSEGGIYTIQCYGRTGNICNEREVFCLHSWACDLPLEDEWLTQKLLIEHDEKRFLRVAHAIPRMPVRAADLPVLNTTGGHLDVHIDRPRIDRPRALGINALSLENRDG